jgi:hypothetical protein
MPAIQLSRLRQRCAELADHFDQPDLLANNLHSLLREYADRTHRTGQAGEPAPLLLSYNVPKPVLRQIQLELMPLIANNRELALRLCDLLWNEEVYEMRLLAVTFLGQITPQPPEPILERVNQWGRSTQDEQFRINVFEQGLNRVRLETPERLISQIDSWLSDPDLIVQKMGLMALNPLIMATGYENVPTFFRQISPFVRTLPPSLRNDVRDTIQRLARRSPIETAHFLQQYLTNTKSPDAAWLTRQCLQYLPYEYQELLREILRSGSKI